MKKNNININNNKIDIKSSEEYRNYYKLMIIYRKQIQDYNSTSLCVTQITIRQIFRLDNLENKDNTNINIYNEKKIDNHIDIDSKINETLEKQKENLLQEYEYKYSSNILYLTETIKDDLKLNNKHKNFKKDKDIMVLVFLIIQT